MKTSLISVKPRVFTDRFSIILFLVVIAGMGILHIGCGPASQPDTKEPGGVIHLREFEVFGMT